MTWGSNATYRLHRCRYCRELVSIDDADSGETSHEKQCPARSWWRRALNWF
jgi:hypothetical protein